MSDPFHAWVRDLPAAVLAADLEYTLYNAQRSLRPTDSAMEVQTFGTATAVRDRHHSAAYYNRVIGMTEATLAWLPTFEAWFAEVDRPCHVTVRLPQATPALLEGLAQRGYAPRSSDVYLARPLERPPQSASNVVRQATAADLDTVFDLWLADQPEPPPTRSVRQRRRAAHLDARFTMFLAQQDGRDVAMATTFYAGDLAWFGNANTLADSRGRGLQRHLLEHRLHHAALHGCTWAVVDTQYGSVSHRNALRAGLVMAFGAYEWGRGP